MVPRTKVYINPYDISTLELVLNYRFCLGVPLNIQYIYPSIYRFSFTTSIQYIIFLTIIQLKQTFFLNLLQHDKVPKLVSDMSNQLNNSVIRCDKPPSPENILEQFAMFNDLTF